MSDQTALLAQLLSGQKQNTGVPDYGGAKRRRLADMLAQQGLDSSPIQHPMQGVARLAQAWVARDMMDEGGKESATAVADILAPETYEGGTVPGSEQAVPFNGGNLTLTQPEIRETTDPKRGQIISLLTSGVLEPDAFGGAIVDKLGYGKPRDPKDRYMSVPDVGLVDMSGEQPAVVPGMGARPKPPQQRTIARGSMTVNQEWRDGEWHDVSQGPRWEGRSGGGSGGGKSAAPWERDY